MNYVHRHSARRDGPFQTLDCTALTEELFESEVFDHTRGAFTGSTGAKPGLFELAHGGTLFLDEIGELPPTLQSELLRVLESGTFRPVGGLNTRKADVRIVCATNRQRYDTNAFRSDLHYRIACLTVRLPNLVERRSDIPLLAEELLKHIGQSAGFEFKLSANAQQQLQAYDYPGNVRELRNILWLAAVNSPDGRIAGEQVKAALCPYRQTHPVGCLRAVADIRRPLKRRAGRKGVMGDRADHHRATPGRRNTWPCCCAITTAIVARWRRNSGSVKGPSTAGPGSSA